MEFFIFWVAFSLIPAVVAAKRGRSGGAWFFIGLLISPLIATIVVIAIEDLSKKRCEACGQQIPVAARICPFCKKDFSEKSRGANGGRGSSTQAFAPDTLTKKCPDCAESIKLEALVCRFCSRKFDPADVQAAIQKEQSKFEAEAKATHKLQTDFEKDKLSRNLCPKCDAYNAWVTDTQANLRKCEVCGEQYPLVV